MSRDSMELLATPKTTTLKFSPSVNRSGIDDTDPVDQDLKEVHKHERRVFALNDQFIALTRVIKETANSNELMQNELRKQKLRIHERQEQIRQRKKDAEAQVDGYNAVCARRDKAINEKELLTAKLQEARTALAQLSAQIRQDHVALGVNEKKDTSQYDQSLQDKKAIDAKLELVRQRKEELLQQIKESDEKQKKLEEEEKKLLEMQSFYEKKLTRVMARIDAAQKQLCYPCDDMTLETQIVECLEKGAAELEKQIDSSMEDELAEDIFDSRDRYEAFMEIVIKRRRVLRQAQAELTSLKMACGLIEKAPSSRTRGTSVISAMVNMQSKLAQDVVKRVFDKLKKREEALDAFEPKINEIEQGFKGSRPVIEDEWHRKMARIAELTNEVAELERLEMTVGIARRDLDEISQHSKDNQYKIHRLQRLNNKFSHVKESTRVQCEDIDEIRQRLEDKRQVLDECESAVAKKREAVNAIKSEVDNQYAHVTEQEKNTDYLEGEVDAAFLKLGSQSFRFGRSYESQSVCKLIS